MKQVIWIFLENIWRGGGIFKDIGKRDKPRGLTIQGARPPESSSTGDRSVSETVHRVTWKSELEEPAMSEVKKSEASSQSGVLVL